jgi:transposase
MPDLLPSLRYAYWNRQQFQQAELRINNQIKAIRRRVGQVVPDTQNDLAHDEGSDHESNDSPTTFEGALVPELADSPYPPVLAHLEKHKTELATERKRWERNLASIAEDHPLWPLVHEIRGIGPLSFGQVIAEIGDFKAYDNPAKVWKRMGLAVIAGRAQRRTTNKEEAVLQGYNPIRRKVMYIVADNLIKLNKGIYRQLYDERKRYESEHHPELTKKHIDLRARRYMTKRLLRDLWSASKRV